jgi:hypothetical protein
MNYQEYIGSNAWSIKRTQRLEIDGYKCVVCKGDNGLQVHHLHYETLGNEDALHDLVTVCGKCHKFFDTIERYQRYQKRQRRVEAIDLEVRERKDIQHGMESITVQIDINVRPSNAQRADRRPSEQVVESNQADFVKARQDRR